MSGVLFNGPTVRYIQRRFSDCSTIGISESRVNGTSRLSALKIGAEQKLRFVSPPAQPCTSAITDLAECYRRAHLLGHDVAVRRRSGGSER